MTVIRIPKSQLRKGMYIELVECPQFMFDKRRFILLHDADLEAIWAATGEYVVVNTGKGLFGGEVRDPAAPRQEKEKAKTAEAIARSTAAIKSAFTALVSGQVTDIETIRAVSKEMLRTMADGPKIVTELTRLKTKDEGTFMHSLAVGSLMAGLGMSVGLDDPTVELLGIAGILHDFGKLLIPNSILNKQGQLTAVERQIIRNHPELGYQRLITYPDMPEMVLEVCRDHHELLDGSGYPRGLKGSQIGIFIRISTVCDVYDALTSDRPYKKGWTGDETIRWMFEREAMFDRRLLLRLTELANGIKQD